MNNDIINNIKLLSIKVDESCKNNNINREDIRIMAVSKYHSMDKIKIAYDCGLRLFGESKVQEFENKSHEFSNYCKDASIYFIGNLQSNKVKKAIELFDGILSIDSIKLARKINHQALNINKKIVGYIQINIGKESQKGGILVNDFEDLYNEVKNMSNIVLKGIMCIPPSDSDPTKYFIEMNKIKDKYKLDELSLGMSRDYDKAIEYGTNMLRIGTAIFNER